MSGIYCGNYASIRVDGNGSLAARDGDGGPPRPIIFDLGCIQRILYGVSHRIHGNIALLDALQRMGADILDIRFPCPQANDLSFEYFIRFFRICP